MESEVPDAVSKSHVLIPDLIDARVVQEMLAHAIANELRYSPTVVGKAQRHIPEFRDSRALDDLGVFSAALQLAVGARVPGLIRDLGLTAFDPTGYEIEIVAHPDGAFYKRHVDIFTGQAPKGPFVDDRLISLVLYMHRHPRAFTGGELRLYPLVSPGQQEVFVDVVPEHGMAVAFSSWMAHEVRPVQCPSKLFADTRFAVNCWVLRRRVLTA